MNDKDGLKAYKFYAFGNAWKMAYLDGRSFLIDMVLPKYKEGDSFDNPSGVCKMIFRYDTNLNGYNLIGVMEYDDSMASLEPDAKLNNESRNKELETNWDWETSGKQASVQIRSRKKTGGKIYVKGD